jgi:hypothetical protein
MDHWKCNFACFTVSKQQREKVGAIWIIDYIFAGGKKILSSEASFVSLDRS